MNRWKSTVVKERTIGYRRLAGTDFPIELVCEKQQLGKQRPTWVVFELCAGIGDDSETFDTKSEAINEWGLR